MRKNRFSRIVLLEDFVGSGTQMKDVVSFVAELPDGLPILLCPMIVCPEGAEKGRALQNCYSHISFSPVLELPPNILLSKDPTPDEDPFMERLRETVKRQHPRLSNPKCKWTYLGFKSTGALVVMHTNCPNNTIPIIHHASRDGDPWSPLFRRSERVQ